MFLSDSTIRNAKSDTKMLFDKRGFYLKISPAGGAAQNDATMG